MEDIILFVTSIFAGAYFFSMSFAIFAYFTKDEFGISDTKLAFRLIVSTMLIPFSPIVGPYFVYKLWKDKDEDC